jgi:hypothetical protein
VEVTGKHGSVLRLLALSGGHCFPSEVLADMFGYSKTDSVAPMIKVLRGKLGGPDWGTHAIKSDHGYLLDPSMVLLDAFQFRDMVEPLVRQYRDAADPEDLPIEYAEEALEVLEQAAGMWRTNPAIGLEDLHRAEHHYHYEYESLYDRMQRLRTLLALRVGTMDRLRQSILLLENKVSDKNSPDTDDWRWLIRAYHSTGNPSKVQETVVRARRYYDIKYRHAVPQRIEEYYERSQRGDEDFTLFRLPGQPAAPQGNSSPAEAVRAFLHQGPGPAPDRLDLLRIIDLIGVTTHSELRLPGSRMEPAQLMRRVRRRLWFSGVLASKWVVDPNVRTELSDFLSVLDHLPEGDVRFMIMNPDGPAYRRLRELRGDELSAEHLPELARLTVEHSSFHVKTFDHLPKFRIHVLDNDVVTFSFYRLDEESYLREDQEWASPHVALDPLAAWPLAEAFAILFNEMWQNSSPLDPELYI